MKKFFSICNQWFEKMRNIYNKTKQDFLFAVLVGILIHFVVLADYLFNHDALVLPWSSLSWTMAQGKWFAGVTSVLKGALAVHYISGIIGIITVAMICVFIFEIYEIEDKMIKNSISLIIMSFPSMAVCLIYNALDYFAITALMSIVATFIATRMRGYCWLISVIILTLSIGSYQGYVGFAAIAFVLICIKKISDTKNTVKQVIGEGIYYISILLFSMTAYYIVFKLISVITGVEVSSYKGVDNMIQILQPDVLLNSFVVAYKNVWGYLWYDNLGTELINNAWINRVYLIVIIGIMVLRIYTLLKKKEWLRTVIFIFLNVICVPLSVNIAGVLSNNTSYYYVTIFPFVMLFIHGYILISVDKSEIKWYSELQKLILVVILFFLSYRMFILDNNLYEKSRYCEMQFNAKTIELVTRMHSEVDYTNEDTVVFVGVVPYEFLKTTGSASVYEQINVLGFDSPAQLVYSEGILQSYINNILSYEFIYENYSSLDDEYNEQIDDMPVYPENGGIKKVDNYVFIKLSESY